jgi:hypothetical protein
MLITNCLLMLPCFIILCHYCRCNRYIGTYVTILGRHLTKRSALYSVKYKHTDNKYTRGFSPGILIRLRYSAAITICLVQIETRLNEKRVSPEISDRHEV